MLTKLKLSAILRPRKGKGVQKMLKNQNKTESIHFRVKPEIKVELTKYAADLGKDLTEYLTSTGLNMGRYRETLLDKVENRMTKCKLLRLEGNQEDLKQELGTLIGLYIVMEDLYNIKKDKEVEDLLEDIKK